MNEVYYIICIMLEGCWGNIVDDIYLRVDVTLYLCNYVGDF